MLSGRLLTLKIREARLSSEPFRSNQRGAKAHQLSSHMQGFAETASSMLLLRHVAESMLELNRIYVNKKLRDPERRISLREAWRSSMSLYPHTRDRGGLSGDRKYGNPEFRHLRKRRTLGNV